ncbi:MAG: rhomboid family intramembrane serine protease [Crocinitomicaceae bacterium]|nr:rhomboid family intramembrane serine protease [Crocinitomicaceae bacterium]
MKITFNSPVVLGYAFISAIVYFALLNFNIGTSIFVLRPEFDVTSFTWYISLFGYGLGHGSADHLIGNMTFILLLGPVLEEKYGSKNLLIMILSCVLITAILHIAFFSHGLLGASGVVFMFIILVSLTNYKSGEIPLTFILIVLLFVGKEIWQFFDNDGISHFAHIMGGAVGAVFGMQFGKAKE